MVILGKALGNGFGISAVMGKKSVMDTAQDSFISSSYWTERTGYAAALETLNQFESKNVINYLKDIGGYFRDQLEPVFNDFGVKIDGMTTVPILIFKDGIDHKTYFTQEMLKKGFLASNVIYLSFAHTKRIIDKYKLSVESLVDKFNKIKSKMSYSELLDGPPSHSGFKRLT